MLFSCLCRFLGQNILVLVPTRLRRFFAPPSFPSILRTSVAHMRVSSSVLFAVAASAGYTFALYLSSLVPFPLIYLYSRPKVALSLPCDLSSWLMLAFHLSISFRLPFCTCMCNILPSSFIFSLRSSHSLSPFGRWSLSIGVNIRRYVRKCNYRVCVSRD